MKLHIAAIVLAAHADVFATKTSSSKFHRHLVRVPLQFFECTAYFYSCSCHSSIDQLQLTFIFILLFHFHFSSLFLSLSLSHYLSLLFIESILILYHLNLKNESSEAVGSKAGKEAAAGKAAKGNSNFYGYGSMSYPTPVPAPTVVPTLNLCAREVVGTFDLFGDGQCVDFDDKKFNGVGVGYDDNLDRCMSTCKCVGDYTDVRGIELFDEETSGKLCICLVDRGLDFLEFLGLMCDVDGIKYDTDPAAWATGVVARAAAPAERTACCYGVPFFRLPSSQHQPDILLY